MENHILKILILLLFSWFQTIAQSEDCTANVQIPFSFSYNGFIIYDDDVENVNANMALLVKIVKGNPQGVEIFKEIHHMPFARSGFFQIDVGSKNESEFIDVVYALKEAPEEDFYIAVYFSKYGTNIESQFKFIGSKKILTVPYAFVSSTFDLLGDRGVDGQPGEQGAVGATGAEGPVGPTGASWGTPATGPQGPPGEAFNLMPMRSFPPGSGHFYVDDGTNTADGKPRLRHKVGNTWFDL